MLRHIDNYIRSLTRLRTSGLPLRPEWYTSVCSRTWPPTWVTPTTAVTYIRSLPLPYLNIATKIDVAKHIYLLDTIRRFLDTFWWLDSPNEPRPLRHCGFEITLRQSILGTTPLDEGSARRRPLTAHNTHKGQNPCPRRDSNPQA